MGKVESGHTLSANEKVRTSLTTNVTSLDKVPQRNKQNNTDVSQRYEKNKCVEAVFRTLKHFLQIATLLACILSCS